MMRAEDVGATFRRPRIEDDADRAMFREFTAALLAHGSEHGVVILPDGTLRGLEKAGDFIWIGQTAKHILYRLTDPGEPT